MPLANQRGNPGSSGDSRLGRSGVTSRLPGLATLRQYRIAWLPHDIVAGLVLTTMLVPVGIAYGVASGVPGIYGLYATIVPLLVYALFGPSRILVLGPARRWQPSSWASSCLCPEGIPPGPLRSPA